MWEFPGLRKRVSSDRPIPKKRPSSDTGQPISPNALLAETLRRSRAQQVSPHLKDEDVATKGLNKDLATLADVFPDIQVDLLRELLKRFDGDSRLQVCIEQLYKYKPGWSKGRLQVPPREIGDQIPLEQQFRNVNYVKALKRLLCDEFPSVKDDTLKAVMAEANNSYTKARPILHNIYSKSTWNVLAVTFGFRKKKTIEDVPTILLERGKFDQRDLRLLATGSKELDAEVDKLFLLPLRRRLGKDNEVVSFELARILNQDEAEQAGALFECQVCYNDLPFEDITACTSDAHIVCLNCTRRALNEALFGQGWAKSVNTIFSTLSCLASSDCDGHIPYLTVKRTIITTKAGSETWSKFESRLATDSLTRSALPTISCPFCPYAEADIVHTSISARQLRYRFRFPTLPTIYLILLLEAIPAFLFFLLPIYILFPNFLLNIFYTSLAHLASSQGTSKFTCLNPPCSRKSCLKCFKAWSDPHICHEPLILSLRKTVEAARTAAVKRTCPRCDTSFVKSSGCNKLTCVCGYSMCYLCRQNIGKSGREGAAEGAQGYRHFCEHFRPNGGKCAECEKCDLYKSEREDEIVKRAGEEAERLWREREGMVGVKGLERGGNERLEQAGLFDRWWTGEWTWRDGVDGAVKACVILVDDRQP